MAETETKSIFKRARDYFIPKKGDRRDDVIKKIVFLFSVAVFVVSVVQLGLFLKDKGKEESYQQEIMSYAPQLSDLPAPAKEDSSSQAQPQQPAAPQPQPAVRELQDWGKKLLEKNKDVVGWLSIPSHKDSKGNLYINAPVVKGKDNSEYLYINLDRRYSISGTLFADYGCTIEKDKQSGNVTIYGHHMGYMGTAFTHLHEYKQGVDFLKKNPVIQFNTIYDGTNQKYAIVGCFISNITPASDNGTIFNYWTVRNFTDKGSDFKDWIENVKKRSWYSSDINCTDKDEYITLSTCSNECFGVRWVIVGKKLTEKDDLNAITSSYKDKAEKDIYFPAVWTNKFGNKKVYKGWDF